MKRRDFIKGLALLGVSGLGYTGYRHWPESGFINPCHSGLPEQLSAHPLYEKIWQDIDASRVWDCHVHLIGTGDSGTEDAPWFSPRMDSYQHPVLKLQKRFYMNGGCVDDGDIDGSAIDRLVALSSSMPRGFKSMLFAFEWWHDEQGKALQERSIFHIPNSYAARVANSHPSIFEWVASIHPARPDAIDALHESKAAGAKAIKWLPQAMNIDPALANYQAFYQACADIGMPIICHSGRESAVPGGHQHYGNPLRMRRALDTGVKVALAHCASDGHDIDIDQSPHGPERPSFELFSRLMDSTAYEEHLYGEISALTLRNHEWAIRPLLQRPDWHHRLLNGSDYPLPGIMPLMDAQSLYRQGLLDQEAVIFLQSIKPYHALLFDFALKRLLNSDGYTFAPSVFHTRSFFES